jgi:hypothetical protein
MYLCAYLFCLLTPDLLSIYVARLFIESGYMYIYIYVYVYIYIYILP